MIQSTIETKASPQAVWELWQRAHSMDETFVAGQKGALKGKRRGSFSYRILEVCKGQHFTILWKSLFVRLVFTHAVSPIEPEGSLIRYSVRIRGPFAWPMRWLLSGKIQNNLALVLRSISKELELDIKPTRRQGDCMKNLLTSNYL
jgi:hypothetical protein